MAIYLNSLIATLIVLLPCSSFAKDADKDAPNEIHSEVFGLKFGASVDELNKLGAKATKKPNRFGYEIIPPTPHPYFDEYRLNASKADGLCEISAVLIEKNGNGSRVYDAFSGLKKALIEKYGSSGDPDEVDVAIDSTDDAPLMRRFVSLDIGAPILWNLKANSGSPTNIGTIMLEVIGIDSKTAIVALGYKSMNSQECLEHISAEDNAGL